MMRRHIVHAAVLVSLAYGFLPGAASAQSQITGIVTDVSGGVLPGVTVEASSPALIERCARLSRTTKGDMRFRPCVLAPIR